MLKPPLSINVNPATNQLATSGLTYDNNGNMTAQSGMAYVYDVENRMTSAPGVQYGYDGQNKRNYKATVLSNGSVYSDEFYFYGADGKKIGTYYLQTIAVNGPANLTMTLTNKSAGTSVASVRWVDFRRRVMAPPDRLWMCGACCRLG